MGLPELVVLDRTHRSVTIESIESGRLRFFVENNGTSIEPIEGGPFVMVNAECGDCTIIGSNIVPDFWIE